MKFFAIVLSVLLLTPVVFAQHNHDGHGTTAASQSPHGGVVKAGKSLSLELMTMKMGLAVFPLTNDGKEIPIKNVTLKGVVTSPKNKQTKIPVVFSGMMNHFMADFERKGTDPLELHIDATYNGKTERFVFPLESK